MKFGYSDFFRQRPDRQGGGDFELLSWQIFTSLGCALPRVMLICTIGNSCGKRAVPSSRVQYHVQIIRLNDEEFRPNERACNPQMRYSDGHLGNFRQ